MSPPDGRYIEQDDGRRIQLRVCEIYRSFGNAYASDDHGHRFLVNAGSRGVDFQRLKVGQTFVAHVNARNYVDQVWPVAS